MIIEINIFDNGRYNSLKPEQDHTTYVIGYDISTKISGRIIISVHLLLVFTNFRWVELKEMGRVVLLSMRY